MSTFCDSIWASIPVEITLTLNFVPASSSSFQELRGGVVLKVRMRVAYWGIRGVQSQFLEINVVGKRYVVLEERLDSCLVLLKILWQLLSF